MDSGFHDYSGYRVRSVEFDGLEFIATLYIKEGNKVITWKPSLKLINSDFKSIEQAFLNFGKPSETDGLLDYGRKYKSIRAIKQVVDNLVRIERERFIKRPDF